MPKIHPPRGRPPGIVPESMNRDTGPNMPDTVSIQLPNRRHELFARFVAEGETYANAYELAGYNPSTANASTLANKPEIADRIRVLRAEKEDRQLKFEIELRKANLDPNDPQKASREVAEWTIKQVLDLYYENARLAQMAGEFRTANESLDSISKIMGLLERPAGNSNDKPPATQVGIAIYQEAAKQLGQGGGVSVSGTDNPLAPRVSGPKNNSGNG